MKTGQTVYFWYSCSYTASVEFVRWCKNGKTLVKSDWLFKARGGTRTHAYLEPHTKVYRTEHSALNYRNAVPNPLIS